MGLVSNAVAEPKQILWWLGLWSTRHQWGHSWSNMASSQHVWKAVMLQYRASGTVWGLESLYSRERLKFRLDFVYSREGLEVTLYMKAFPCLSGDSSVLFNLLCQNTTRCNCWAVKLSKFHLVITHTFLKGR